MEGKDKEVKDGPKAKSSGSESGSGSKSLPGGSGAGFKEPKDQGKPAKSSVKPPSSNKRPSDGSRSGSGDTSTDNKVDSPSHDLARVLGEIKNLGNSQAKSAEKLEERLDAQAAQIAFLTDEWNLKVDSNGQVDKIKAGKNVKTDRKVVKAAIDNVPSNPPDWPTDSDEERLSEACDDYEEGDEDGMEEEEDDEDNYDEVLFGKDQKGVVPTKEEIAIFKKRTRLGDEFAEEEWRDIKSKNVAKYFVGLPEARDFSAPLADMDVPDLKYKNRKNNEKDMYECHKQIGAINLVQIKLAEEAKGLMANAGVTMGEFADPDIPMADPRQEASQSFEGVKKTATDMMKLVGALGKMSTNVYLKLLNMRRSQYVESVDSSRVARNMVKRLKPSTRYLFGDNLKQVCRTLKEGSQLSSQLLQKPRGGRGGTSFRGRGGRGARSGYRGGYRGGAGFRGGFRPRGGKAKKN